MKSSQETQVGIDPPGVRGAQETLQAGGRDRDGGEDREDRHQGQQGRNQSAGVAHAFSYRLDGLYASASGGACGV